MAASKGSRAKILRALNEALGPRTTADGPMHELFPYASPLVQSEPSDDRSVALIAATVIEQGLEAALLTKFVQLDPHEERYIFSDDSAPLRHFDAKIRLAYALGIIGENAKEDLSVFRKIRNTFAHSRLEIDFSTPVVHSAIGLLNLPNRVNLIDVAELARKGCSNHDVVWTTFTRTSVEYALALVTYGHYSDNPDEDAPFYSLTLHG